jgi:hypothetical protein
VEKIKSFFEKHREQLRRRPILLWSLIAGLTLAIALYREASRSAAVEPNQVEEDSVDTFIPAGFVLVPIEVVNYESLDSVLGRFGVVDLFATDPATGGRSAQVASRIRILRAPRNPNQFAVLAPESESRRLVSHAGGFYVIVQNPKSGGTAFEKQISAKPRRKRLIVEMNSGDEQ